MMERLSVGAVDAGGSRAGGPWRRLADAAAARVIEREASRTAAPAGSATLRRLAGAIGTNRPRRTPAVTILVCQPARGRAPTRVVAPGAHRDRSMNPADRSRPTPRGRRGAHQPRAARSRAPGLAREEQHRRSSPARAGPGPRPPARRTRPPPPTLRNLVVAREDPGELHRSHLTAAPAFGILAAPKIACQPRRAILARPARCGPLSRPSETH